MTPGIFDISYLYTSTQTHCMKLIANKLIHSSIAKHRCGWRPQSTIPNHTSQYHFEPNSIFQFACIHSKWNVCIYYNILFSWAHDARDAMRWNKCLSTCLPASLPASLPACMQVIGKINSFKCFFARVKAESRKMSNHSSSLWFSVLECVCVFVRCIARCIAPSGVHSFYHIDTHRPQWIMDAHGMLLMNGIWANLFKTLLIFIIVIIMFALRIAFNYLLQFMHE